MSSSVVIDAGKFALWKRMPTVSAVLAFIFTYCTDAGSLPTKTSQKTEELIKEIKVLNREQFEGKTKNFLQEAREKNIAIKLLREKLDDKR